MSQNTMQLKSGDKVIAGPDGWFKPGTVVTLEDDFGDCGGVFRGIRICETASEGMGRVIGQEYEDSELCPWDEFTERA